MYLSTYPISSPYGSRAGGFHHGVDFATPVGVPIPAVSGGEVNYAGSIPAAKPGYPYELIVIVQSAGYFIVYGHLSQLRVRTGQTVGLGQILGLSGASGYVTGPHLHIEQRLGTKEPNTPISQYQSVDITPLLKAKGGNQVTEEQNFANCFITQAQRWPTKSETDAWKKSGTPAYTWVQRNAPNPSRDRERVNAFKACFIALATRWPTDKEVVQWRKSGLSAFEWCQKHAPNVAVDIKEAQIRDLHIKLEEYEQTDGGDAQLGRKFRQLVKEVI